MKNKNDFAINLGEGFSPEHDELVFEAEAYFKKNFKVNDVKYELPVEAKNKFIIGYIDLIIIVEEEIKGIDEFGKKVKWRKYKKYAIEVKPAINSFGALLRQLNTYKLQYALRDYELCVYSNDKRYMVQLESQGYKQFPTALKTKAKKS